MYPAVNKTEAASPTALPNDNKTAVTIPGIHDGKYTLKEISVLVEPSDKADSNNPRGN